MRRVRTRAAPRACGWWSSPATNSRRRGRSRPMRPRCSTSPRIISTATRNRRIRRCQVAGAPGLRRAGPQPAMLAACAGARAGTGHLRAQAPERPEDSGSRRRASSRGAKTRILAVADLPSRPAQCIQCAGALALAVRGPRSPPSLSRAGCSFRGLPHRIQRVANAAASPGTTIPRAPTSAPRWPRSRDCGQQAVLIAGGDGKDQDFTPLRPAVARHARAVVLIGRERADRHGGGWQQRAASVRSTWMRPCARLRPALAGRRGAAVAGLRQLRHVPQLRTSGAGSPPSAALGVEAHAAADAAPASNPPPPNAIDSAAVVRGLLLLGLVMVYSASIAIAEGSRFTGNQSCLFPASAMPSFRRRPGRRRALSRSRCALWQQAAPWLFLAGPCCCCWC